MAQRLFLALIGPDTLFLEGLKRVLRPTNYQVKTVSETIDSIRKTVELDLILFVADADETALQRVKEENPGARVVIISDNNRPEMICRLVDAGIDGYLLKTVSSEVLLASLNVVMLGGTVLPPLPRKWLPIECEHPAGFDENVSSKVQGPSAHSDYKRLSDRETDVLLCLMKGESNKIIARKFDIAEATVKVHLKAILRKIRVSNRTQAAVWAHNNQLAFPARVAHG